MQAIVNAGYGPSEILELKDIPKPSPKPNEVLVKIYATTVNRTDCGLRAGKPYFVRFIIGLFRPPWKVMGSEFSGVIEAVGSEVSEFKPGDEVFGLNQKTFGAHAEFMSMPASGAFALKPANLSFEESVAIIEGPWLAMNYFHAVGLNKNHKILINGTSGSIGSSGLQLAKHFGADVTAVINTKNVQLAKDLRADRVIDYQQEDFTRLKDQFDFIFDAVGKSSYSRSKHLLKPNGIYFSTELGPGLENIYMSIWGAITRNKKVIFPIPKENKQDILLFKALAENGELKPVIDRYYSLDQVPDACRYVETGEKTGNVVVRVVDSAP
jgi:NADPH:quinone reductase-like Zn-dependent oxidoreductase